MLYILSHTLRFILEMCFLTDQNFDRNSRQRSFARIEGPEPYLFRLPLLDRTACVYSQFSIYCYIFGRSHVFCRYFTLLEKH